MRAVKRVSSFGGAFLVAMLYLALPGLSFAATQTLSTSTTVSGEVRQVDCLGNSINNPSEIIYPYPIVCIETVNGPILVEPNLVVNELPQDTQPTSRIYATGPFGAVLNILGIEGSVSTVAVMTMMGVTMLIIVFVVLRAMGLISTRGLTRFLLGRPRLK